MHTATLRDRTFYGEQAPDWATAVAKSNGFWYWEETLQQRDGDRFQNINCADAQTYESCTSRGFSLSYLLPPLQQDDPLPPVPEDGLYFNHNNKRVATLELGQSNIAIGVTGTELKVRLTPETALVMAHDLRRMAMHIKRNQKSKETI